MSLGWIPNAISLMRIALVVPMLMLILQDEFSWALGLFFFAGFSDGLDGYLAKRFDWRTRLAACSTRWRTSCSLPACSSRWPGRADSCLARSTGDLQRCRDIRWRVIYNFLIEPVEGEPTRISKLNTVLELLFLLFVLSHAGFGWPDPIATTVLGASILVTVVISGADYVWSWSRRARAGGKQ